MIRQIDDIEGQGIPGGDTGAERGAKGMGLFVKLAEKKHGEREKGDDSENKEKADLVVIAHVLPSFH